MFLVLGLRRDRGRDSYAVPHPFSSGMVASQPCLNDAAMDYAAGL